MDKGPKPDKQPPLSKFSRASVSFVQIFTSTPEISRCEILIANPSWGRAMYSYEIKIIGQAGNVSLQIAEDHLSDFAAIRTAKKLCGIAESIEVWRGEVCIYSERPKPLRLVWPAASGKASA